MATVNQPNKILPTNKMNAQLITGALVNLAGLLLRNLAPEWYDPEVMLAMTPVVMFIVGWFVKDAPNT